MPYRPTSRYREALHLDEIPDATPGAAGVMSAADKAKLDRIPIPDEGETPAPPRSTGAKRAAAQRREVRSCVLRCEVRLLCFRLSLRVSVPLVVVERPIRSRQTAARGG